MKRRLALTAGALVAAVAFSSCASANNGQTVAEVNGHQLTVSQLATLSSNATKGDTVRDTITKWIEVVAVSDDANGIRTAADLGTRKEAIRDSLITDFSASGRAEYEKGLDGSPALCLAVIPIDDSVDPATVLAEIDGGTSFADAAAKYSTDATLAKAGGLVTDPNGAECIAAAQFNPDLVAALTAAKLTVGVPTATTLSNRKLIVLLRPFDSLSKPDQLTFAATEIGTELAKRYGRASIRVDPRYGKWDGSQSKVVPLGES